MLPENTCRSASLCLTFVTPTSRCSIRFGAHFSAHAQTGMLTHTCPRRASGSRCTADTPYIYIGPILRGNFLCGHVYVVALADVGRAELRILLLSWLRGAFRFCKTTPTSLALLWRELPQTDNWELAPTDQCREEVFDTVGMLYLGHGLIMYHHHRRLKLMA